MLSFSGPMVTSHHLAAQDLTLLPLASILTSKEALVAFLLRASRAQQLKALTWSRHSGLKTHLCYLVGVTSYLKSVTHLDQSSVPQFPQLQHKDASKSLYHIEFL